MASVQATVENMQEAAMRGGVAISTLARMQINLVLVMESIGQARDIVAYVNQDELSTTLNSYSEFLAKAHQQAAALNAQLEEIKSAINAGQDMGERFIRLILG